MTPVPAWGALPLDIYLLNNGIHLIPTHLANYPISGANASLASGWILGRWAESPTIARTRGKSQTYMPAQATQQHIDIILRPLRPEFLRCYATGYKSWVGAEGMWIRTSYDAEYEEAHRTLWNECVDISQVIGPNSLVLKDEGLFGNANIARVLEQFPERLKNYSAPEDVEWSEQKMADFLQMSEQAEGESAGAREQELSLGYGDLCRKYWMYHAACVVTCAFIEDAEAQSGGEGFTCVFG